MKHMRCPECGRVSSVPEWMVRPICVHARDAGVPEVWDADDESQLGADEIRLSYLGDDREAP